MVASHNQLHIDITADCTSAVDAFEATKAAARSLNRENAEVSVSLSGAREAADQMEQVRQARINAGGMVKVGVDTDGMDDAERRLGSYRREVQGLAGDVPAGLSKHAISVDTGSLRRGRSDVDEFARSADRGRVSVEGRVWPVRCVLGRMSMIRMRGRFGIRSSPHVR